MLISFQEVPEFLYKSDRYISTYEIYGEESEFEVGIFYPPENENVNNLEDFKLLFHTYDIWGLDHGEEFMRFITRNRDEVLDFLLDIAGQFTQAKILLKEIMVSTELKFSIDFQLKEKNVPLSEDGDTHRENYLANSNLYELSFILENKTFEMVPCKYDVWITHNKYIYVSQDFGFDDKVSKFIFKLRNFIHAIENGYESELILGTYIHTRWTCQVINRNLIFNVKSNGDVIKNVYKISKFNKDNVIYEFEKLIEIINSQ